MNSPLTPEAQKQLLEMLHRSEAQRRLMAEQGALLNEAIAFSGQISAQLERLAQKQRKLSQSN